MKVARSLKPVPKRAAHRKDSICKALDAMMIKSAERALAAGKRKDAAEYCRAVLVLHPRQREARALLKRLGPENAAIEARRSKVIKKRGLVHMRRGYTSHSPLAPRDKILRRGFPSHSPLADG